ncbi:hypothetical protein [Streptosporangium sp. NPDC048865]|uniref:hypothetical protein n=1 Tax=Streptosporangium sp. NPDC048865 TaxID=3155766 RepID=UPI00343F40FA
MQVRNAVAYPLLAAVVVILTLTAAVAWKHRRREIVLTQSLALLLAFALLVMWKPYRHVEDFQPPLLGSRMDVAANHQLVAFNVPAVAELGRIKTLLTRGEEDGWWHFEASFVTDAWHDA